MWLVTCDMWHVTRGTWQVTSVRLEEVNLLSKFQVLEVTCDTWHGTPETWHWISDTWHMTCATHKGWWTLYQNCRSLALWGCPVGWTQIHFVLWSCLFIKKFKFFLYMQMCTTFVWTTDHCSPQDQKGLAGSHDFSLYTINTSVSWGSLQKLFLMSLAM